VNFIVQIIPIDTDTKMNDMSIYLNGIMVSETDCKVFSIISSEIYDEDYIGINTHGNFGKFHMKEVELSTTSETHTKTCVQIILRYNNPICISQIGTKFKYSQRYEIRK